MPNQPESSENRNSERERGNAWSGSGTQMRGGWSQRGRGGIPSARPDGVRDQSRGSGTLGQSQHTNAGSTGTSGGQISPQPGMAKRTGGADSGRNG